MTWSITGKIIFSKTRNQRSPTRISPKPPPSPPCPPAEIVASDGQRARPGGEACSRRGSRIVGAKNFFNVALHFSELSLHRREGLKHDYYNY